MGRMGLPHGTVLCQPQEGQQWLAELGLLDSPPHNNCVGTGVQHGGVGTGVQHGGVGTGLHNGGVGIVEVAYEEGRKEGHSGAQPHGVGMGSVSPPLCVTPPRAALGNTAHVRWYWGDYA